MSKILKRNFLFKNFVNGYCRIALEPQMNKNLNQNKTIYNINKKNFVYHKKDDAEEFGKTIDYIS
jgi:hypothetical protein